MAITITGGKYAAAAVASVGTSTVTVSGTPFVSGDFAVARRVDLFSPLGSEVVSNGAFASDTAWTKGSGVTISGGVANCSGAAMMLAQTPPLVIGQAYRCSFDYVKTAGANIRTCNALDGSANIVNLSSLSASGTISFFFVAVATGISLGADTSTFTGTIDNFSVAPAASFKGMAFVRSFTSTSALQLETPFFNPITGATVTQAVGDSVLISKNWADSVTSGISMSGRVVTVSDSIVFGTSGISNSVAFHDESVVVVNTINTVWAEHYNVAGGFVSFGHLQNWAARSWYGGVNFYFSNTQFSSSFGALSTAARFCMWGGSHKGNGASPLYFAGIARSGAAFGTDWSGLWALDVKFDGTDINTPLTGYWSNPDVHIMENCSFVGSTLYQILVHFNNGLVLGGQYKILNNSADPLSASGSDNAGTYAMGAPPGKRTVISDIGPNTLWRSNTAVTQTINVTNLISTDYRAGLQSYPEASPNNSATVNVYFADNYSNLQDATALSAIRDSDWSIDSSSISSGAASTSALTIFRSTGTGHTMGGARGPWTYRIRKYGFNEIEGAIAESTYSLGTAGTAFDVSFGGFVNQIARASLTDSVATALAYTGITVTDHGASPVTWNSKAWSISVAVDLATYPSRTAAQVFAHVKAKIAATATWGGKVGLLWHVLMEESAGAYVSQRGKSGGAGASLKGVRIIDQAGNPLVGVSSMVADDGTTYTPPVAVTLTISANVSLVGAELRIYDLDNSPAGSLGTELTGSESCPDATFPYVGVAGNTVWVQIMLTGYREFGQSLVFPAANSTFSAVLTPESDA